VKLKYFSQKKIPPPTTNINNYKQINLPEQNDLCQSMWLLNWQYLKVHQRITYLHFAQATTSLSSETFYSHFESHEENPSLFFSYLIMPDFFINMLTFVY